MQLKAKVLAMAALAVLGMSVLALGIAAAVQAGSHDAPDREARQQLAELRQATAKYQDFQQACDDGWVRISDYVPNMGLHFSNGAIIDDASFDDHTSPQVLLYVPRGNNRMQLVAVEYLAQDSEIPEELFSAVGPDAWDPTPILGIAGLHAWVWQGNPDGVFSPFNPSVPAEGPVVDCP